MEVRSDMKTEGFPIQVSRAEIDRAVEDIKSIAVSIKKENIDFEEFKKLIDSINEKLRSVGIYLSFDNVASIPFVRVKTASGEVIKVFPPEEVVKLMARIKLFFETLVEIILSKYA